MPTLEIRRHTNRQKPGQHLSQEGVSLARRLGNQTGPFARVVTSPVPRAYETALAMGFAVDQQLEMLASLPDEAGPWEVGFFPWGQRYQQQPAVTRHGRRLCDLLTGIAKGLADDQAALIITHGGIVELAAVACLPEADHAAWGPACGYCEGVRLSYDPASGFIDCAILRVQPTR
jgi:hypothetical protein